MIGKDFGFDFCDIGFRLAGPAPFAAARSTRSTWGASTSITLSRSASAPTCGSSLRTAALSITPATRSARTNTRPPRRADSRLRRLRTVTPRTLTTPGTRSENLTTVSVHFQDSTYHAEVSRILQNVLGRPFRQATAVEDLFGDTDFVADETHDKPRLEVAARLRSETYREIYPCSLLLRTGRPSGRKTELQKMLEGHGHFYFYGFRNEARNITAWLLFNLDKARAYSHFRYVLLSLIHI